MLKHFPGPEVREEIHSTILAYTKSELSRLQMHELINLHLDMYKVKKLAVRNYTVKQSIPVTTPMGTFPVIIIEAKHKVYNHCPTCGNEDEWGYLAGEAPVVKVMCHGCGAFYERRVPSEAVNEGG